MKFFWQKFFRSGYVSNFFFEFSFSYATPSNLTYFWNFGFLALVCLVLQIITGLLLAMYYVPNVDFAFSSIEHLMRDVYYGYFLRYSHSNGASMFFFVVYLHMIRGFYYGSFLHPREFLWISGVVILFLMIATAFLGYVLPWGQMSFWAATVITNLASAVPLIGTDLVYWIWGGFSVDNPTLNRFFSLHFFLPFLLLGLVFFHLCLLHNVGSGNPLGYGTKVEYTAFTSLFLLKDFTFFAFFLSFACIFVFFLPNFLGHPDNSICADSLVTPTHIVPEWYFLPFYAILRAFPDKLMGVVALLASIFILFILPFFSRSMIRSSLLRFYYNIFFFF